eukprot:m.53584 g.53584  ORF g.53584 m.53584 type:complete len:642 (+) comp15452_c0_seq1:1777-3702(+)
MSDGCAGISRGLMRKIMEEFVCQDCSTTKGPGSSSRRCSHYKHLVDRSAFQGRLGAAKGVWYVDSELSTAERDGDLPIEIRDSMLKYHIPDPTAEQLCVEVNNIAGVNSLAPAPHLNRQVVRLLEARGVPRSFFTSVLQEKLQYFRQCLKDDDILQAEILADSKLVTDSEEARIRELINAGYTLADSWILRSAVAQCMHHRLRHLSSVESLLQIERAQRCIIVADPTGTLAPHECIINTTRHGLLHDQKVVLARSPCYLPGELLVLDAVCPTGTTLTAMRDVVVLSTQGLRPPADMMQGGDYDGDTVLAMWDEGITQSLADNPCAPPEYDAFDPADMLAHVPSWKGAARVGDVLSCGAYLDETLVDVWIAAFRNSMTLGFLTNLHEYWADKAGADWTGTAAGKNATLLGFLCFLQMDANSTGNFVRLTDSVAFLKDVAAPWYHKNADTGAKPPRGSSNDSASVVSDLHALVDEEARWYTKCDLGNPCLDMDFYSTPPSENIVADARAFMTELRSRAHDIMKIYHARSPEEPCGDTWGTQRLTTQDKAALVKHLISEYHDRLAAVGTIDTQYAFVAEVYRQEMQQCQSQRQHLLQSRRAPAVDPERDIGPGVEWWAPRFNAMLLQVCCKHLCAIKAAAIAER